MKRIVIFITIVIAAILIFILIAPLMACDIQPVATVEQERVNETSMFVVVEETSNWTVVYHKQTKVMYVYSWARRGDGHTSACNSSFTVLLNADGTPMLWKGE